ncbi:TPA: hypothetical protein LVL19_003592 [Klebsiella michiganensis]|nr:hypothetical protein [Klebsiella michiganensis]
MMTLINRWLPGLFPALVIGLIVGSVAAWRTEEAIHTEFQSAVWLSSVERQSLIADISDASAAALESRLEALRNNESVVERHFTHEIINPVFRNVCATDEYVRLFNESTATAARTLAGEPPAPLPGKPADAGG